MHPFFSRLSLAILVGGGIVPAYITESWWPIICSLLALYYLLKLFSAIEAAEQSKMSHDPRYQRRGRNY